MKTKKEVIEHLEFLKNKLGKDEETHEVTKHKHKNAPNLGIELDLLKQVRKEKRNLGELRAQIKIVEWIIED